MRSLRDVVCEILEGAGYTVLVADGGAKALQIADEYAGAIQLIVTDVIMPGMSGRQAAEKIKAARSEVQILFISGYTSEAIAKHGVLEAGSEIPQQAVHDRGPATQDPGRAGRSLSPLAAHCPQASILERQTRLPPLREQ